MSDAKKPGYLINFQKQTSMLGEAVTITFNLPEGATEDEITQEIIKCGNVLHRRMLALNEEVLKKTQKNLSEMGIETGTIYEKEAE